MSAVYQLKKKHFEVIFECDGRDNSTKTKTGERESTILKQVCVL